MPQIIANANQTLAEAKQAVRAGCEAGPILGNAEQIRGQRRRRCGEANQRLAEVKATIRDARRHSAAQTSMRNPDRLAERERDAGTGLAPDLRADQHAAGGGEHGALGAALMNTIERDPNALLVGRPASRQESQ